jgi:hypothetical protein
MSMIQVPLHLRTVFALFDTMLPVFTDNRSCFTLMNSQSNPLCRMGEQDGVPI